MCDVALLRSGVVLWARKTPGERGQKTTAIPEDDRCACPTSRAVAYQRARLGSRRGSRGFASLTLRVRPPSALPWSP
jgi:hypothetical protein